MADRPAANVPALGFYNPAFLPRKTAADSRGWLVRIAAWLSVAAVFAIVLRYDIPLMRWRYSVFPEGPKGLLKQVFYGFRDFSQIMPIFVAMLIVIRMDKLRRWTIVATILIAQIFAGIGYNTCKLTMVRYRPQAAIERVGGLDEIRLSQTWAGFMPQDRDEAGQSFPSGHSAGAFAFAGVLVWFYPRLAGVLWFLAVGCACSRYVDAVHWLSDCVAGASIGYAGAWLALRPHTWAVPLWVVRKLQRTPPLRA